MKPYKPAEDSHLLAQTIKKHIKNKNIKVLDMGTGSGIQSENLINLGIKKQNITASDINPQALKKAKALGVKTIKSNLFEKIPQKFDFIIFNPPYLPKHKYDFACDTNGGKKGDEIIIKFIKQLPKHLEKNGKALLLTSSLTPKRWKNFLDKMKIKKLNEKKLFFEKLFVWEID